jgi:hypothetical protein
MLSVLLSTGWLTGAISRTSTFFAQSFVPFLVISFLVDTVYRQKLLMLVCIIAACLMVHNGMVQLESPDGLGWTNTAHERGRITYIGIFSDPNDLGMFLVMVMPFVAYFMYKQSVAMKVIWMSVLLWLCYGVYMTNSRGTLLGTFTLCGSLFLVKYGWKKSLIAGAIFAPVALVIMTSFREISAEDSSSQGRLDAWYAGYEMLVGSPIWGVGKGLFMEHHMRTAHNSAVQVMAEMGFVGLFLWAGFIYLTIKMLLDIRQFMKIDEVQFEPGPPSEQARIRSEIAGNKEIALVLLFSFVAYGVTAFFLSRAYAPVLFIYTGFAVATYYRCVMLSADFAKRNYNQSWGEVFKLSLLLIFGVYLFVKVVI